MKRLLSTERVGTRHRVVLAALCGALAAFVTLAFVWATLNPDPGNTARYFGTRKN